MTAVFGIGQRKESGKPEALQKANPAVVKALRADTEKLAEIMVRRGIMGEEAVKIAVGISQDKRESLAEFLERFLEQEKLQLLEEALKEEAELLGSSVGSQSQQPPVEETVEGVKESEGETTRMNEGEFEQRKRDEAVSLQGKNRNGDGEAGSSRTVGVLTALAENAGRTQEQPELTVAPPVRTRLSVEYALSPESVHEDEETTVKLTVTVRNQGRITARRPRLSLGELPEWLEIQHLVQGAVRSKFAPDDDISLDDLEPGQSGTVVLLGVARP